MLAIIGVTGTPLGAYIAQADPAPADCVAYVSQLRDLDQDMDAEEEAAFARVAEYDSYIDECGTPASLFPTLGGD